MAKVTLIYYPLTCIFGGDECTCCDRADEICNEVYCKHSNGWAAIPKVIVKESKNIEFTGFDGYDNWELTIGRQHYTNLTASLKLLKIDDVVIYEEKECEQNE